MTKMLKYNGQHIVAACLTCNSMMSKNKYRPCFLDGKLLNKMKSISGLGMKIIYYELSGGFVSPLETTLT